MIAGSWGDPMPTEASPELDRWLRVRGWDSYEEWEAAMQEARDVNMNLYYRPPDDYEPPTECEQCHQTIMYGPVIGGHIWSHVGRADHDVVMRTEGWWDVATGTIRYGNGRDELGIGGPST